MSHPTPAKPAETVAMPDPRKQPDGFWTVPGGADGLSGSIERVIEVIQAATDADMPQHHKNCIIEAIRAEALGTDHNFVQVRAHAVRARDAKTSHSIVSLDIRTSKRLI